MGGVKGRSGPPHNLNSTPDKLKRWLVRDIFPFEKAHIRYMLMKYRDSLIRQKGGIRKVQGTDYALINNATLCHGLILLLIEEARDKGWIANVGDTWKPVSAITQLMVILGVEQRALALLRSKGRDSESRKDLAELLDAMNEKETEEDHSPPFKDFLVQEQEQRKKQLAAAVHEQDNGFFNRIN